MANSSMNINADPQIGQSVVEDLKREINNFGNIIQDSLIVPFAPLTIVNPDLGEKYLNELKESSLDIYNFLGFILGKAENYFVNDLIDRKEEKTTANKKSSKESDVVASGGRISKDDEEETRKNGPIEISTIPKKELPTLPIPEIDDIEIDRVTLLKINTKPLEEIDLSSIFGFNMELINLAKMNNKKLDELLADPSFAQDIKRIILNSPYIPQAFKDIIKNLTDEEARIVIEALFKGEFVDVFLINPLNISIVYNYLQYIAEENKITVEELLNNPEYANLLRESLEGMKEVVDLFMSWEELTPEQFQENLLNLYDGNGIEELEDRTVNNVRTFVDTLCEKTDIGYEELLTDNEYAETIKQAASEYGKCATFFYATSCFTDEGMQSNARQMFDGTNYKAFAMTEDNINGFKEEMNLLANENSTTTETLLTDSKYADTVKEALQNSENALGVGEIFNKSDSSVSQNVAKNLYNTDLSKDSALSNELSDKINNRTTNSSQTFDNKERENLIKRSETGLIDVTGLRKNK
ncbi:MAG: hypothetical protein IJ568_05855 [Bacilli bacterium]|nr:hypothetical protein [Bacilli bacterium]